MSTKEFPKISVGDIVIPYNRKYPLLTLENPAEGQPDAFIRAKKHDELGVWFSDIDSCPDGKPKSSKGYKQRGCIVFVPRMPAVGEGVLIGRVFGSGSSAKGTIIELPEEVVYPYDHDTVKLFKQTAD